MIEVDILDSSPVFLDGLVHALSAAGIKVVGAAVGPLATTPGAADVYVLDPAAFDPPPGIEGGADTVLRHIADRAKLGAVLVLGAAISGVDADRYRLAGAVAVMSKCELARALVGAVRAAASGAGVTPVAPSEPGLANDPRTALSEREEQVLWRIAQGFTHSQVARRLGISRHTVDTYVRRIRAKLGVGNKAELTRVALRGYPGADAP